jgi:hypothetical protein
VADKKKYHKLDEIGIVGKQEKRSAASQNYHKKKTGDFFRQVRSAASESTRNLKRAS